MRRSFKSSIKFNCYSLHGVGCVTDGLGQSMPHAKYELRRSLCTKCHRKLFAHSGLSRSFRLVTKHWRWCIISFALRNHLEYLCLLIWFKKKNQNALGIPNRCPHPHHPGIPRFIQSVIFLIFECKCSVNTSICEFIDVSIRRFRERSMPLPWKVIPRVPSGPKMRGSFATNVFVGHSLCIPCRGYFWWNVTGVVVFDFVIQTLVARIWEGFVCFCRQVSRAPELTGNWTELWWHCLFQV